MFTVDDDDMVNEFTNFFRVIPEFRIENKNARAAIGGDADPISGMETVVERNAAETRGRDTEIGFDVRILIAL
ncbi:unannotated protein [freshwater metagenome]|uniref:Unannotated protein n=1 Tax=freshwater metagenome TaxID=449393 RepID=A0A6J7VG95_9ZZZZ